MTLFDAISVRKSVRKFEPTPLPAETLAQIETFLTGAKPLFPGIRTEHRLALAGAVKGMFLVKAPHYLIISSEEKEGFLLNAGFLYQQLDLYLSSQGLGCCWLGMAKPTQTPDTALPIVITMALGRSAETPHRARESEFKRKAVAEIAEGEDPRLPYARLAPSGMNSQPWFVRCHGGSMFVYRRPPKGLIAHRMDRMNQIDLGIFLCHLYIAGEALGMGFSFEAQPVEAHEDLMFVGKVGK